MISVDHTGYEAMYAKFSSALMTGTLVLPTVSLAAQLA